MSYNEIDDSLIQVGKPTRKEIFQTVKDNFVDHEDRISNTEAFAGKIIVFDDLVINLAQYAGGSVLEQLIVWRAPSQTSIVTAEVTVLESGSAGIMEFDIKKTTNISVPGVSVFTTKPSVAYTQPSGTTSSNAIFASNLFNENEWLVVDITQIQTGIGRIQIRIIGEPT